MKTLIASVAAASGLLTGCVAVPLGEPAVHISGTVSGQNHHRHARPHHAPPPRYWRDRDGDGVPNGHDRRPHNPYRY
jgi:hypothetical protein